MSNESLEPEAARPFPVPTYRDAAGDLVYDAPHEPRDEYTIRVKTDGVFFSAVCDEVPGLHLSGTNLSAVLADFELSVRTLLELDAAKAASGHPHEDAQEAG